MSLLDGEFALHERFPRGRFFPPDFARRIEAVGFGVLAHEEVLRRAVVRVSETKLHQHGWPAPNSVNDHRLGVVDRRLKCATCRLDLHQCPGHSGAIELTEPVYHVLYIDVILRVLKCLCFCCARPLLSDAAVAALTLPLEPTARLAAVVHAVRNVWACPHCAAPAPRYTLRDSLHIHLDWSPNAVFESDDERRALTETKFNAAEAASIVDNLTDEDAVALGFPTPARHPRHMFIRVLSVPPVLVRPSVMLTDGGHSKGQDDLTYKLQDILKANNALHHLLAHSNSDAASRASARAQAKEAPRSRQQPLRSGRMVKHREWHDQVHDARNALQWEVATYFNNKLRGQEQATQRSGAPTKCLIDRLKGKEGRVRHNLMGKRVNQSARSVIIPAPELDIDEIGVPACLALELSVSERVNTLNYASLIRRVHAGAGRLDGASRVRSLDGRDVDLAFCADRSRFALRVGDQVERPLRDGDWAVVNRQPTLHKMSMMGHRVRLTQGRSLGLNLAVTTPYNADFDGDEMNLHIPQSEEARAEVATLMAVPHMMVNAATQRPIIALVQNTLVGSYRMSLASSFVTREQFAQLAVACRYAPMDARAWPRPAVVRPRPLWTGKQVWSYLLLPRSFRFGLRRRGAPSGSSSSSCPLAEHDQVVRVHEGQLWTGELDKQVIGTAPGSVVHMLWLDYGVEAARRFASDAQRLVTAWLDFVGFSCDLDDCTLPRFSPALVPQVHACLERVVDGAASLLHASATLSVSSETRERVLSAHMGKLLAAPADYIERCAATRVESSGFAALALSGSKGSTANMTQIMGVVGQQSVDGRRPSGRLMGRQRHLDRCVAPERRCVREQLRQRGAVLSSFRHGLTAMEFYAHAMGGREGLVDTAVKTYRTGYLQRKLMKGLESVGIGIGLEGLPWDERVRDADGRVVQFEYGHDGWDRQYLERVDSLRAVLFEAEGERREPDPAEGERREPDPVIERLRREPDPVVERLRRSLGLGGFFARVRACLWPTKANAVWAAQMDMRVSSPLPVARWRDEMLGDARPWPSAVACEVVTQAWRRVKQWCRCTFPREYRHLTETTAEHGEDRHELEHHTTRLWVCAVVLVELAPTRLAERAGGVARLDELLERLSARLEAARVQPGEMVGALAATSVGEPSTQMTLRTFHSAGRGSAEVQQGVPRLGEIMSLADSPKTPLVGVQVQEADQVDAVAARLIQVMLGQVVASCDLAPDHHTVVWHLDATMLRHHMLDAFDVAAALEHHFGAALSCRVDDGVVVGRLHNCVHLFDALPPCCHAQARHVFLRELNAMLCRDVQVGGLEGVRGVRRAGTSNTLFVSGASLTSVMCGLARYEWFATRCRVENTWSNKPEEMYDAYGIEAAHGSLCHELASLLAGSSVDAAHEMLVVERMTWSGALMPYTRHGMNRQEGSSPFAKASFEETAVMFVTAAGNGEVDPMRGVTEAIMLGQEPHIGTGCTHVHSVGDGNDDNAYDPARPMAVPLSSTEPRVWVSEAIVAETTPGDDSVAADGDQSDNDPFVLALADALCTLLEPNEDPVAADAHNTDPFHRGGTMTEVHPPLETNAHDDNNDEQQHAPPFRPTSPCRRCVASWRPTSPRRRASTSTSVSTSPSLLDQLMPLMKKAGVIAQ